MKGEYYMKYWMYYQIRNSDGDLLAYKKLYAMALTKEDKGLFEKYRNMNLFICEKTKRDRPDKNDVLNFNRYRLKLSTFQSINEFGLPTRVDIQTTCDEEEKTVLYYDKLEERLLQINLPNPKIFSKRYLKYLQTLGYQETHNFAYEIGYMRNIEYSKDVTKVTVDEFKVFMKLFGYTMKGC